MCPVVGTLVSRRGAARVSELTWKSRDQQKRPHDVVEKARADDREKQSERDLELSLGIRCASRAPNGAAKVVMGATSTSAISET